jgi:hypothetical protein
MGRRVLSLKRGTRFMKTLISIVLTPVWILFLLVAIPFGLLFFAYEASHTSVEAFLKEIRNARGHR